MMTLRCKKPTLVIAKTGLWGALMLAALSVHAANGSTAMTEKTAVEKIDAAVFGATQPASVAQQARAKTNDAMQLAVYNCRRQRT